MSPRYPGQPRKDSADLQTWAQIPAATDSQRRGSAVTRPAGGPPEPRDSRTLGEQRGWNPTSPLPSSQVSRSATLSLSFLLCKKGDVFVSWGCRHNHPKFSGLKTTGVFFSSPRGRKSKVGLAGPKPSGLRSGRSSEGGFLVFVFSFRLREAPFHLHSSRGPSCHPLVLIRTLWLHWAHLENPEYPPPPRRAAD